MSVTGRRWWGVVGRGGAVVVLRGVVGGCRGMVVVETGVVTWRCGVCGCRRWGLWCWR